RLNNDLIKAGQQEEDLKQLHNNYMLQIQSLINPRALSASSGSRTVEEAIRKNIHKTAVCLPKSQAPQVSKIAT
ncbi:MAG: hypothetical protein ACPK85_06765, partial [Methanosarcina sp.]